MRFVAHFLATITIACHYCHGYTIPTMKMTTTSTPLTTSRRDAFSKLTTAGLFGISAPLLLPLQPARAIDACPAKSKNCVRATWTAPSGASSSDAIASLRDAIKAYPQEGQEGNVDGGGWVIVSDDLEGAGTAAIEYKSSGKGNFAKFFNGGKPFTDDLILEVSGTVVEVRSSSRVGESDFGVNAKRVGYLAQLLSAKGWSV